MCFRERGKQQTMMKIKDDRQDRLSTLQSMKVEGKGRGGSTKPKAQPRKENRGHLVSLFIYHDHDNHSEAVQRTKHEISDLLISEYIFRMPLVP